MDDSQSRFVEACMQYAAKVARFWFDDPDDIADFNSVTWEFAQTGRGTPATVTGFAVLRVRSRRHFSELKRSITCPRGKADKPSREVVIDFAAFATGDDPAENAAFRIDYAEWRDSLTENQRQMLDHLASGWKTGELAAKFKVTPAAIVAYRRRLELLWCEYVAD